MDDTDTNLDDDIDSGEEPGGRPAPEPIRPSVGGHGPTMPASEPASRARPRRSPWRIFVYVFVLACLVFLSLLLRSGGKSVTTKSPPPAATSTQAVNPVLPGIAPSAPPTGGPIIDSDFAKASCTRADVLQGGFTLIAAFETTAGTAAAWEDALAQGAQTSPLHEIAPDMKVAVCYIDGPWQPPQNVADLYHSMGVVADRAVIVVPETGAVPPPAPIAPHDSLPILRPASPAPSPHP
jgi:hypothetical protein